MASQTPTYINPSPATTPRTQSPGSTPKPTLLAFHGSGSNATIHTVQLARLARYLKPTFNIISVEAPFPSPAGPGILPFFEGCGPYKRWLPPHEKVTLEGMKRLEASGVMPPEVEDLLRETVEGVQRQGGRVVGLLGFSQGTRVVAGILRGAEIRRGILANDKAKEDEAEDSAWLADLEFAVSMCGAYPPPLVPASASRLLATLPENHEVRRRLEGNVKVQSPTIHVQGKQDEWAWSGRMLIDGFYEVSEGKSEVLDFEMGHHYPVVPEETERIKDWIFKTWKMGGGAAGVQRERL